MVATIREEETSTAKQVLIDIEAEELTEVQQGKVTSLKEQLNYTEQEIAEAE